jgi:phosphoribosyl 1,2-cyclic phosphate phosphodiesterase
VPTQEGGGKPKLDLVPVSGQFDAVGVPVIPIPVMHGEVNVFGYRIGDFAYITDCNNIPKSSMDLLQGLDVLVLGALRHQPHSTHFTLAEAVEVALDIKAKETYFVHMSHGLDHEETNQNLPPGIQLAYDGLIVKL